MITTFCNTRCSRGVDVKVTKDVVGPGKPGAKSAMLKKYHPLIEKTSENGDGLLCLPQVSITPEFMSAYLKRIGASYEKPEEARTAIEKCGFSISEKEAFEEAVLPFNGTYIAVRSDESTAAGVGLWHTGFMAADSLPEGIAIFEGIARKIMESEFSDSVFAFKKRAGLPTKEPPGIFITPLVGYNMGAFPPIFGPPFQANVITRFANCEAMVSMGFGIGGANTRSARTRLLRGFGTDTWSIFGIGDLVDTKAIYNNKLELIRRIPNGADYAGAFIGVLCSEDAQERIIGGLREGINRLDKTAGRPLYLELASNGRDWAVVQCAEANLGKAVKPDVPESQKILEIKRETDSCLGDFGIGIFGRKVAETDMVVYLSYENIAKISEINKSLGNYVIIAPELMLAELGMSLKFWEHSNAAAIICNPETTRGAGTHLSGAIRETGIIVLAGNVNREFLKRLKDGVPEKRKLLVYANDALEEAFVATMD